MTFGFTRTQEVWIQCLCAVILELIKLKPNGGFLVRTCWILDPQVCS